MISYSMNYSSASCLLLYLHTNLYINFIIQEFNWNVKKNILSITDFSENAKSVHSG